MGKVRKEEGGDDYCSKLEIRLREKEWRALQREELGTEHLGSGLSSFGL